MKYVISPPGQTIRQTILLPASKSISNRLLVMRELEDKNTEIQNLSGSDDTRHMLDALAGNAEIKDIGHAGTAMRFLSAFYAVKHGKTILTGSDRMKERPIGPLVDALRSLGARISYLGSEGCPPLEIEGGKLSGGKLTVDGGISSQFISALMMIGPVLEGGLEIELSGRVVSPSYIEMTSKLMEKGGIKAGFDGRVIRIEEGSYHFGDLHVESDWSGASYWYMIAALNPGAEIRLPLLEEQSLQGDAVLKELYQAMGVESTFMGRDLVLRSGYRPDRGVYRRDFTSCPDLAQTCAASLCALGIPFHFTGTRTLRVKETDRIHALQVELAKLGFSLKSDAGGDWISFDGLRGEAQDMPCFATYNDHRMALAFAPLSLAFGAVCIDDPLVVSKSYPAYWDHLRQAGFSVSEA